MNRIQKTIWGLIIFVSIFFVGLIFSIKASEPLNIYLFYGEGCPHCAKEKEFLDNLKIEYGERILIKEFEVYYNQENSDNFIKVLDYFDIKVAGVPLLIIGNNPISGFGSSDTTGVIIKENIDLCISNGCSDIVSNILNPQIQPTDGIIPTIIPSSIPTISNTVEILNENTPILSPTVNNKPSDNIDRIEYEPLYINTYVLGKIDLKNFSLPIATILIALVDGFNPCAMWILIFLITMLINMQDKKKLYILGSIFIITSGIVYFFFLAAWLNFFKFIGFVYWIKVIIGIVAIMSGFIHIKTALFSKGECHATNEIQRESIINKIKRALSEKSFILSVIGIVTLAITVNMVEVVCSAGLPAIYTNLLSSIELSNVEYYSYLILYTLIFMFDDLIIFFIAIKTFEVTGIAKKYTKMSNLIGGIIIFIIGIVLILKPELLMFG